MASTQRQRNYRIDIDCLRAFAMMAVVLYHCHFQSFAGGFTGVDIFFVISGYVMFRTVSGKETFGIKDVFKFYQKRLFRIYPAILMTLFATTLVAVFVMSPQEMDYFGKQMSFAALSLSNILFAQGQNYFSANTPILLHTWSLAVEMQFYVLFPFFIMALRWISARNKKVGAGFILLIAAIGLGWAEYSSEAASSFFLLQNRAFEFMAGVAAASLWMDKPADKAPMGMRPAVIVLGLAGILLSSTVLFKSTGHHPGLYTLWPVLPAAALMALFTHYAFDNKAGRVVAYIGRLSYGIYLLHFPVIYFVSQLVSENSWTLLAANIVLTLPLAALSYHLYETPLRRYGYKQTTAGFILAALIIMAALGLAAAGYITAKKGGWPQRLRYINPFAYDVALEHEESREFFTRGYDVKSGAHGRILFIGDSVLQQYIDPMVRAMGVSSADQIDSVTRGGCVLLKGVDFEDTFADISCNGLRNKLYALDKTYDYIVLSQEWSAYHKAIRNAQTDSPEGANKDSYAYIFPFLEDTLAYWQDKADHIIVLGVHPHIKNTSGNLEIGPTLSVARYNEYRDTMTLGRQEEALLNKPSFEKLTAKYKNVSVLHPVDILCSEQTNECRLHNDQYSYFRDGKHITKAGQEAAEVYFTETLK